MLTAIAINCTLKSDPATPSSTDAMIAVVTDAFAKVDVAVTETIRIAAHDVKPACRPTKAMATIGPRSAPRSSPPTS